MNNLKQESDQRRLFKQLNQPSYKALNNGKRINIHDIESLTLDYLYKKTILSEKDLQE